MSFQQVATQIIKDSIVSSLYIDDKIVEPFVQKTQDNAHYFEISKGLYDSFRNEKKSIDFYKFSLQKDWKQELNYILKNRDLLVLDWQLDDAKGLKQTDTLSIIQEAVAIDGLHFISIYTETPEKDFNEIFYTLKSNLDKDYNSEAIEYFKGLLVELDETGIDTKFFEKHAHLFKEIALISDNKILVDELKKTVQGILGDDYKIFAKGLKKINSDILKACEIFGYFINKEACNDTLVNKYSINNAFLSDRFIVVNHTIIQVTNKSNPQPKDHFNVFANALQKVCGNPLTLVSLEIRSLLRESSGFIGKDADKIPDTILYHHKANKKSFYDFLTDILKSHTFSYFNYKNERLLTMRNDFWNQYYDHNGIAEKLEQVKQDETQLLKELANLNVYYNVLHISKEPDEKIKFGDLFLNHSDKGVPDGKFYLCITAHCDCLEPTENIKNNFFFIKGQINKKHKEVLNNGDSTFCSYVKHDNETIIIEWDQRPIILNIPDSKVKNNIVEASDGINHKYYLHYKTTLKENYTQRLANFSFPFTIRVGIDFAGL